MAYMFNIDVTASLRGLLQPSPEVNLAIQHDDMGITGRESSDANGSGAADDDFVPPESTVPEIRTTHLIDEGAGWMTLRHIHPVKRWSCID